MNDVLDWASENPHVATPAIVFGSVFGTGLIVGLAAVSPFALVALAGFVFLAWLIVRTGALAGDSENEPDPLTELERRYVRDEITEAEFERRLSTILDAEEQADRDPTRDLEFEFETDR